MSVHIPGEIHKCCAQVSIAVGEKCHAFEIFSVDSTLSVLERPNKGNSSKIQKSCLACHFYILKAKNKTKSKTVVNNVQNN